MKILHVNKFIYRRGGAEAYMLDLSLHQAARGHETAFFGMSHPENIRSAYEHFFPPRIDFDPPPPGVIGKIRLAGRMIHSSSARSGIGAVIDAFRPDVAHLNNIYHQLSPSILGPLEQAGVPMVMTLHDYKLACPTYQFLDHGSICTACLDGSFLHAVKRRCNRDSLVASVASAFESSIHRRLGAYEPIDLFICPSEFMHQVMAEAGVYPDRLVHLDHFADLSEIAPASEPGEGVIFAGRLSHEKGVDVLIEAIGLLEDVHLVIAGDGPERASLEALAEERARGRVSFLGRLGRDDLHQAIRAAAVLAIPSVWFENQPMIIMEAFGCGRPVIGTELGGIPELIRDGVDGRLVRAGSAQDLAAAIRELTQDNVAAHGMGLSGRSRAAGKFGIERHLTGLEALYDRVCEPGSQR